jgi:hypothetical protein
MTLPCQLVLLSVAHRRREMVHGINIFFFCLFYNLSFQHFLKRWIWIRIRIKVQFQELQRLKNEPWTLKMEAWRLKMEPWEGL